MVCICGLFAGNKCIQFLYRSISQEDICFVNQSFEISYRHEIINDVYMLYHGMYSLCYCSAGDDFLVETRSPVVGIAPSETGTYAMWSWSSAVIHVPS